MQCRAVSVPGPPTLVFSGVCLANPTISYATCRISEEHTRQDIDIHVTCLSGKECASSNPPNDGCWVTLFVCYLFFFGGYLPASAKGSVARFALITKASEASWSYSCDSKVSFDRVQILTPDFSGRRPPPPPP